MTRFAIFKAPDRQTYALEIEGHTYVPVLACVYESGTDDPQAVANRLLSTGIYGFWTEGECSDDWEWLDLEDVDHEKWNRFLQLSCEVLNT